MSMELLAALLITTVYLTLLVVSEVAFRRRLARGNLPSKTSAETMRKVIHLLSGLMSLAFPFLLSSHWTLLILISGFVLLLIAGQKFKFTKAINSTGRDSLGDILFPISIYCL